MTVTRKWLELALTFSSAGAAAFASSLADHKLVEAAGAGAAAGSFLVSDEKSVWVMPGSE